MFPLLLLLGMTGYSIPDAVFLEHSAEITALPDSGYIEYTREVIVLLTGRGVERYRLMSITHRECWESIEVLTARTGHWRSGRAAQTAEVHEAPHRSLLSGGRLETTLRETIVSFPGLERGDTLILEVVRRIDTLPVEDFYSYSFYSGGRDSVDASSLSVIWPVGRPFHTIESAGFTAEFRERSMGNSRTLTWTCGPSAPAPAHYLAPNIRETVPRITIAGSIPEEVSRGFSLVIDDITDSEEAIIKADSILEITGTAPERIRKWVASEIDYLGADWGEYPGFSPRSPLETLTYRSGVCRDKALMLVWLLRRAGWSADLILTCSSGIADDLVGSRSFDHMMARVCLNDGNYLLLDPTVPGTTDGFGSSYRGLRYLALTDPGSPIGLFPDPLSGDSLLIRFDGDLDTAGGEVTGEIEIRLTGAADDLFRSILQRIPEEKRGELLDVLTGAVPGSGEWQVPDPSDTSLPLRLTGSGRWSAPVLYLPEGAAVSLPGLMDMSLLGTRMAAYLLPEEISPHGIRLVTPFYEVLDAAITGFDGFPVLPGPGSAGCWRKEMALSASLDTLLVREECLLGPVRPDSTITAGIIQGLQARCDEWRRVVLFR